MATALESPSPIIVPADGGEHVWFSGTRMTIKAPAERTGGAFGLVEALAPAGFSPPLHVHRDQDEVFWILEGEVTFRCGERTFSGRPGSLAFLPRGVAHSFVVEGHAPARLLSICVPGGFERYFADAGRPAEHDGLPPQTPPDVARLRSVGEAYGVELVGPPLTPAR